MRVCKVKDMSIGEGKPKVCLPIVGKTNEDILTQAKAFEDIEYDMVELRIDFYESILDFEKVIILLKELKTIIKKPLLFTYRSLKEGGQIQLNDDQYIELIRNVCESQLIDIVDVELLTGNQVVYQLVEIAHVNHMKVLISNHNFELTPDNHLMRQILEHMEIMNADILKIAYMPLSQKDVLRLMEITMEMSSKLSHPIVSMSMGEIGKISRICGEFTGSAMTFASATHASAPGQIAVNDVNKILEVLHHD
ncbi:MAG: type I 3-dehydroquinate dehydratase [Coprobacillus sp.]